MVNKNKANPTLFALLKEEVDEIANAQPQQFNGYMHRKANEFVRKVKAKQKEWFLKARPILENQGNYEFDYTLNLDDVFVFHNPFNNYEVPMYEVNVLRPQPKKFFFFQQKSLWIARIRLVGLFFEDARPIFEAITREGALLVVSLRKEGLAVKLQGYAESDTEEFVRLKTDRR